MPLIAIRVRDGAEIESFSVNEVEWKSMKKEPIGSYIMRGSEWPAILKRSIRGLHFFAHAPGFKGVKPEPESIEHLQAKAIIAKSLRAAGYAAIVEKQGVSQDNEAWQADVFCETKSVRIAFEIQLSQQTLDEYLSRSFRYQKSGVQCIWLVRCPGHFKALGKAITYKLHDEGKPYLNRRAEISELAAVGLEFQKGDEASMKVIVFPPGIFPRRIALADFAVGILSGKMEYTENGWQWVDDLAINL